LEMMAECQFLSHTTRRKESSEESEEGGRGRAGTLSLIPVMGLALTVMMLCE
jgi:hypothetical protein